MNLQLLKLLGQADHLDRYLDQYGARDARHPEAGYWFPEQASTMGADVDFLYWAILWVCAIFFAIIVGVMCYFVVKYRRRPGVTSQPSTSHNTTLEILWSVIPSILLVWFFYEGARGYMVSKFPPESAEEIVVTGKKWDWTFTYPDGDQSAELHLVLDRPVKLVMRSEDVLHSFFVPAFRQKMDVVPGRYTYYFVKPIMTGIFRVFCTEYCGDNHSIMKTWCHVHKSDAERKAKTEWLPDQHKAWENGERLFRMNCAGCHNVNGTASTGPALNLIWGEKEKLVDGSEVLVDENYVAESIRNPNVKVVAGYGPVSKMQTFEGKLSGRDIDFLIAYLKHLKAPGTGDAAGEGGTSPPAANPGDTSPAGDPAGKLPDAANPSTPAADSVPETSGEKKSD